MTVQWAQANRCGSNFFDKQTAASINIIEVDGHRNFLLEWNSMIGVARETYVDCHKYKIFAENELR